MGKASILLLWSLLSAACYADQPARPTNLNPDGGLGGPPRFQRAEEVRAEHSIDGITIDAVPVGASAWALRIGNAGIEAASVIWDESSFVSADGEAFGRLVRSSTRKGDVGLPQPPMPVPSQAAIAETVIAEKLIAFEEYEAYWGPMRYITRQDIEQVIATRSRLRKIIDGGRLLVVIAQPAGKQTWTGRVHALPLN